MQIKKIDMHSCVRKVLVAKVGSKLIFLINGIKHFGSQFWLKIKSKFVYYPLKNQPTNQTVFGLIIYADFDNLVWRYTFSPFINTPPPPNENRALNVSICVSL